VNGGTLHAPRPFVDSWGAEELAATLDSVGTGIWALDLDGRCVFINQAACRTLGHRREECLGEKIQCRIHAGHCDGWVCPKESCHVQSALASGSAAQVDDDRFQRRDGTAIAVKYSIQPVAVEGRMRGSVIGMVDITARKRAEEGQRKSDEWLGFAQNAAGVGIFDLDLKTGEARVSEGQFRLYGLGPASKGPSREEWRKLVHPEDRERMDRQHELALSGVQPSGEKYRIVWPDGSVHWLFSQPTVFFDEAGRATRLVGVSVDITGRVRAETALDQFFSASPTPMAIAGFDGRIQRVNPAWEPILEFTAAEAEGTPLFNWIHP
jgi:PAS domain S-box-containing protein